MTDPAFRLPGYLAGFFLVGFLLAGHVVAAEPTAGGFLREFYEPVDAFELIPETSTTAMLICHFAKGRSDVRPFVLATPSGTEVQWRLAKALAEVNGVTRTLGEGEADLASWIEIHRYQVSDIPLLAFSFPRISRTNVPATPGGSLEAAVPAQVLTATLELTSSVPLFIGPAIPMTEDSFGRIGSHLVANPKDLGWIRAGEARKSAANRPRKSVHEIPGFQPVVQIETIGSGIFRLTADELERAGLTLTGADWERLALVTEGEIEPVAVDREQRTIWFPLHAIDSVETNSRVSFLGFSDSGEGAQIKEAPSLPSLFPASLPGSTTDVASPNLDNLQFFLEQDDPAFEVVAADDVGSRRVFWKGFLNTGESLPVDFDLPGIALDGTTDTVLFRLYFSEPRPDLLKSAFSLIVNGSSASFLEPVNVGAVLEYGISPKSVFARGNQLLLTLEHPPEQGNVPKPLHLDKIEINSVGTPSIPETKVWIEQPRFSETISPLPPRLVDWQLTSKANPHDWVAVRIPELPGELARWAKCEPQEGGILGPSSSYEGKWWMADLSRAARPQSILPVPPRPIRPETQLAVDLLVLADERFHSVLVPYLERRRSAGWSPLLVSPAQVYNDYSDGNRSIDALKQFITEVRARATTPRLEYVWLIGESRWDPKDTLGSGVPDLMPTWAMRTGTVTHAGDSPFTFVAGDDRFPDLHVGRVSVETAEELSNYLAKVVEDEDNKSYGWWRAQALFLMDEGFKDNVRTYLKDGLEAVVHPTRLSVADFPQDPIRKFEAIGRKGEEGRGIRQAVVEAWSTGQRLVEYTGHGGITVWSHEALFKGLNRPDSDVLRLNHPGRYSYVFVRSCLSASINWPLFPGNVSVAEALIKAPSRGALAVLGPSGTEFAGNQERFGTKLRAAYWNHGLRTLGEIRTYAHIQFLLQTPDENKVLEQFILHGDPTLKMDLPTPIQIKSASIGMESGHPNLNLEWTNPIPWPATVQVRVYSNGGLVFESENSVAKGKTQTFECAIPPSVLARPALSAAIYAWNDEAKQDAFGAMRISNSVDALSAAQLAVGGTGSVSQTSEFELGAIRISHNPPAVGESIQLDVDVTNRGNGLLVLEKAEAKGAVAPNPQQPLTHAVGVDPAQTRFLLPGEVTTYTWIVPGQSSPARYNALITVRSASQVEQASTSIEIRQGPHLRVLRIEPATQTDSHSIDEPVEFLAHVRNEGDIPTDPLRIMGREDHGGGSFEIPVQSLSPGESAELPFTLETPNARFLIKTQMELMPQAITSRTRWNSQVHEFEIQRAVKMNSGEESMVIEFDDQVSRAPFLTRLLEPGERILAIDKEARKQDIPAMRLEFDESAQVRSATHAGGAAWRFLDDWWVSPFQIQAHPQLVLPPLKALLPWDSDPTLVLVAPTYYVSPNYQGLGFPMPGFVASASGETFEVSPGNQQPGGRFGPRQILVERPGIPWTFENKQGSWPGISGFTLTALPELTTPVVWLPDKGPWVIESALEWVPKHPTEVHFEVRTMAEGSKGNWMPVVDELPLTGNRIQARVWFVPEASSKDSVIRSGRWSIARSHVEGR